MEVYLDNAATTQVSEAVKNIMIKVMSEDFGNPSSLHMKGITAENYIKKSKENIAKILKVNEKEILFTSGGTESNNTAIIGCARANKRAGMHIITTEIEHASVLSVMKYLEKEGFDITYLKADKDGHISCEQVKEALRDDTIFVSVMHVNNEIGSVMDIEKIGKTIHEFNPYIVFHVDAIQSFGKLKIYPKKMNIDALSVSGHKFHGPKGSGFLYVREGVKMNPLIYGGGQQKGMRSGTENVPAIAGLGQAAVDAYLNIDEKMEKLYQMKDIFIDKILSLPDVYVNSHKGKEGAPHIISVSFPGVRSEVMLHSLEEKGVYVSSGSACSSNKASVSATLKAIGLNKDRLDSTVRFSMCDNTTEEEMKYAFDVIKEILPKRRILRNERK